MSSDDFWDEGEGSGYARRGRPDRTPKPWQEPPTPQPQGCIGDLTMEEVHLDQLRQAVLERVEHVSQIPYLLHQLNQTDWLAWMADAGARITVCAGCGHYVRASDTTALPELVWLGDRVYCQVCAERVLAEHTYTCEACGHDFYAEWAPAPFSICPECDSPGMAFALSSLWTQLQRARKLNLAATLTPREWLDTLEYFDWRCAYCQRAEFACMDHFVPVIQGGGTTQGNCVPACVSCNSAKGAKHPHSLIKADAYTRVAQYLAQFE